MINLQKHEDYLVAKEGWERDRVDNLMEFIRRKATTLNGRLIESDELNELKKAFSEDEDQEQEASGPDSDDPLEKAA